MADLAFPRTRRLTHATEFARVRRDGRVMRGELMNVAILGAPEEESWRAAFITSKRVGGAVVRNRIRRRLREVVRRNQRQIRGGTWMVIIARTGASEANYIALETEWMRLVRRAAVLVD